MDVLDIVLPVHVWGIGAVQTIQSMLQNQTSVMLFFSYAGDPKLAFSVYFPVAFYLHRSIGTRILWVATISEWLNTLSKWMLHGERPYWWVHTSGLYKESAPSLRQFNITCETGPGSPSGHAMITAAVWYTLISDLLFYTEVKSRVVRLVSWLSFGLFMCAVCVSRLYIAAHFPHQVIAGVITGVVIGKILNSFSTSAMNLRHYVAASVGLSAIAAALYISIWLLDLDPQWSITVATKWCEVPEWIHLDTTPFYCLVRDVSSLLGMGVAVWLASERIQQSQRVSIKWLHMGLALLLTLTSNRLKLPHESHTLFYILAFLLQSSVVCLLVAGISQIRF